MASKMEIFYDKLSELLKTCTNRSLLMSVEQYETILQETKQAQLLKKNNKSLSSKQYRRLKRYDLFKIGDSEKLIESGSDISCDSNIRYYCRADELYEILENTHINVKHRGARVMEAELKKKYCNITRQIINLFISLCEQCQLKKMTSKRASVARPILSDSMDSKCPVDLMDVQFESDGGHFDTFKPNNRSCFCCFGENQLVNMMEPQHHNGNVEIYTSMISDCYGIEMYVDIEDEVKNLFMICNLCTSRLRNALYFKKKVQIAYDRIRDYLYNYSLSKIKIEYSNGDSIENEISLTPNIKVEPQSEHEDNNSSDNFSRDACKPLDNSHPLIWIKSENTENQEQHEDNNSSDNFSRDACKPLDNSQPLIWIKSENTENQEQHEDNNRSDTCSRDVSKPLDNSHSLWIKAENTENQEQSVITEESQLELKNTEQKKFQNYNCDLCNKSFIVKVKFNRHMRYHKDMQMSQKSNNCDELMNEHSYNRHLKYRNTRKGKSSTPSFKKNDPKLKNKGLQKTNHLINIHNDKTQIYQCKYCNQNFKTRAKLKCHVDAIHMSGMQFDVI